MKLLSLPQLGVTFISLMIIMIGRYIVMSLFFSRYTGRLPLIKETGKYSDSKNDVFWSMISSSVFALAGALVIEAQKVNLTQIYVSLNLQDFWYIPLSFLFYLIAQDTFFYWSHRLLHKRIFFRFHHAHHRSTSPTAWTSFAFHPVEASLQAGFLTLLLFVIPIHLSALLFLLTIMTLCGLTNHLSVELYPKIQKEYPWVITATHHHKHHHHFHWNYGLYFTYWDKLMGTEFKEVKA